MKTLIRIALPLLLGASHLAAGADQAQPPAEQAERLGQVNFPVYCNEAAQQEFNRGMALFHSFWFTPAIESFDKVLQYDPGCGMAHWGIAFMSMGNPFGWPANPKAMETAAKAMAEAQRLGAPSQRERDYIDALAVFFKDWQNTAYRTRATALEQAMANLAAKYPEDDEAQILYALILDATASPADKSFANQRKAAGILEAIYQRQPHHPGVPHYLIHTYDYAELAEKGLPAARTYADIAPSVPHAQHMPSHIFSRVGLWPEMVESNRASYLAAKGELQSSTLGVGTYDALHAMDYLVFGHLQQAQDRAARQVVDEAGAIRKVNVENFVAAYAFAAIPARYAVERSDWQQAARLELSPKDLAWDKFPQAEAVLVFARGLGAARSGDAAAARKELERLQALQNAMASAGDSYWAGQTDIQIATLKAWAALADERPNEALTFMRNAANAEDASDKHPVTPGNVVSARKLLGDMLLELERPAEALSEYERSLEREPNRFGPLYGAARAAELADDREKARSYYGTLQEQTDHRDTERPELVQAKAFLTGSTEGQTVEKEGQTVKN